MKILGIESSADETVAAVVKDGHNMLSNSVVSSIDMTKAFGGIVPEIAARSHVEVIIPVIDQALKNAKTDWNQIDAIAVTQGPGLIGSLLIGVLTARTLAIVKKKPLFPVNHVLAHNYANFIIQAPPLIARRFSLNPSAPEFPFLSLVVSGGHTQIMFYRSHSDYEILGETKDDAVGEAFDKVAKILGLPYPGGPSVDRAALKGNPSSIKLPKAKMSNTYDFSFSGLKTAVLMAAQAVAGKSYDFPSTQLPDALNDAQKADLAASFQKTAVDTLCDAIEIAISEFSPKCVTISGGVAASNSLREELKSRLNIPLLCPDIKLCTDNAAMIAAAAFYAKRQPSNPYELKVIPNL